MKCSNKVVSFIRPFSNWPGFAIGYFIGRLGVESYGSYQPRGVSAQNQFIEDQLDRADAGSWQIADGGDTVGTGSSFALRFGSRVEPYTVSKKP